MPQAVYQFNTSLLQNISKASSDIVIFVNHFPAYGINAIRWEVDGRRVTSGVIQFITNQEMPDYYIYGMDITHTPGTTVYSFTTALLANMKKCADDMQALFDTISQGYVLMSITLDGRTLTNGTVQVTTNDICPVNMVFGLDVTRVA